MQPLNWLARLVVYGLAVYRVTNLFVNEDGPGDVFDWIRAKAGIYYEDATINISVWDGVQYTSRHEQVEKKIAEGFWAELLDCPLCLSVWFSFVAGIAMWPESRLLDAVASWLALAGVSLVLFGRGEE